MKKREALVLLIRNVIDSLKFNFLIIMLNGNPNGDIGGHFHNSLFPEIQPQKRAQT